MPTNDLNQLADATAARLRAWLLGGAVQQRDGEHAGGIYGAFDDGGAARYVYPEITGYYLHWLADIGSPHDTDHPVVVRRAQAAADWAARVLADGKVPATRAYLGTGAEPDWRNRAVFFFDLAMLLRGLCAAYEADLIAYPQAAIARLIEELARFVDTDGRIQAARSELADAALPPRWSTLGGPFEVKASSRVLLAARHQPLPAALEQACRALARSYRDSAATLPLQMLHPTLYFAEGMLVGEPDCAPQIATLAKRCLALADARGNLPEAEDSTVPRSDIIAQLLRVLLLTGSLDAQADTLVSALAARVDAQGRLPFRVDIAAPQANVWCAMFAEQALRWYAGRARGLPAAEWLV
ncbi:hypothetical protein [Tahibacter harae]|uniref:Uncharacterized protein n=1 Tax=Tahibacter harae TaxID=2963937 RepID=A0ABT1QWV1_9GAMM|nr:hypothetical protein [Tahibacter harae]MCQ4166736.1 hypothetical protein [Tahibacter harae]